VGGCDCPNRSCSSGALRLVDDGRVAVWLRRLFAEPICDGGRSRWAGGLGNWGASAEGTEDGRQAGCRLMTGHPGLIDREVPSPRRAGARAGGREGSHPTALDLERGRLRQRFGGTVPSRWRARPRAGGRMVVVPRALDLERGRLRQHSGGRCRPGGGLDFERVGGWWSSHEGFSPMRRSGQEAHEQSYGHASSPSSEPAEPATAFRPACGSAETRTDLHACLRAVPPGRVWTCVRTCASRVQTCVRLCAARFCGPHPPSAPSVRLSRGWGNQKSGTKLDKVFESRYKYSYSASNGLESGSRRLVEPTAIRW
jgi:hypothetical protein